MKRSILQARLTRADVMNMFGVEPTTQGNHSEVIADLILKYMFSRFEAIFSCPSGHLQSHRVPGPEWG